MINKKYPRLHFLVILWCLTLCLISCAPVSHENNFSSDQYSESLYKLFLSFADILDRRQKDIAYTKYAQKFTDEEKAAQLFMINIDGSENFQRYMIITMD